MLWGVQPAAQPPAAAQRRLQARAPSGAADSGARGEFSAGLKRLQARAPGAAKPGGGGAGGGKGRGGGGKGKGGGGSKQRFDADLAYWATAEARTARAVAVADARKTLAGLSLSLSGRVVHTAGTFHGVIRRFSPPTAGAFRSGQESTPFCKSYCTCTFPVPSLYLPCTFPVPPLYRSRLRFARATAGARTTCSAPQEGQHTRPPCGRRMPRTRKR